MRVLLVPSGDIAPVNSLKGTRTLTRCQKACAVLLKSQFDILVLSGGQCHNHATETQPSAITMEKWFAKQGIPLPFCVLEKRALDTYQNVAHSLEALKKYPGPHDITIVSHWLHAFRFQLIFRWAHNVKIRRASVYYWLPLRDIGFGLGMFFYHIYDRYGLKSIAVKNREAREVLSGARIPELLNGDIFSGVLPAPEKSASELV